MPADLTHLLVIDIETTGTCAYRDQIIEVGAVLLDIDDLSMLAMYRSLVALDPAGEQRLQDNTAVREMHERSGLLADLAAFDAETSCEQSLRRIEGELISLLDVHGVQTDRFAFAGSGVGHFDMPRLETAMPDLHYMAVYYPFDIGTARRMYRRATGRHLVNADSRKTHRALDDVLCHVDELRAFDALFRSMRGAP